MTDIRSAMASDDAYINERGQHCSDSEDLVESDEGIEPLITSMSGGLVDTIRHRYYGSTVQFTHLLWGSKLDTAATVYTVCTI